MDRRLIPLSAILLGECNQRPVGPAASGAPCVREQHQREQARDFAVERQQSPQLTREPDRLARQLSPLKLRTGCRHVALIEDQVQNLQDHSEAIGPLRVGRQLEWNAGPLDALLGAADALRDCPFGHQKGLSDLRGAEAADGAEGERNL